MTKKVVLVENENLPLASVRDALKSGGFEVASCSGSFDALDELGSEGADLVVSATKLTDLSGYQLSCLIKSTERTCLLPVVLVNTDGDGADSFWPTAAQADSLLDLKDVKSGKQIVDVATDLIERAKEKGWSASLVKNAGVLPGDYSSSDLVASYSRLVGELLVERLVGRLTRGLLENVEPRNRFLDNYFAAVAQLFNCHLYGFILASSNNPWGSFKVSSTSSKKSVNELVGKIGRQIDIHKEIHLDVRGELSEGGKAIPGPEVLPVRNESTILGALVFSAAHKKGFDPAAKAAMTQLQVQMQPIMRLLLASQEIESLHQREQYRASTDNLTGLYNLEFLVGFLQQQLLFSYRQRAPVGLVITDIDNFRVVNDEFGYEMGDLVLSTVANRMLNQIRGSDLIARYGGDEFAIVLPNTDINGTKVLAEKLRNEVQQLTFVKGAGRKGPRVTISAGCAAFNMEDLNPETILRDAKLALQRAKEGGRNCTGA